jgi:hypothetical protein
MFVLGVTTVFYPEGINAMCIAGGLALVFVSIVNALDSF